MKGAKDFQEPLHLELVQELEMLFKEVEWETYSRVAHDAGIYGPIIYDVMNHKRGFLTHRDINAILQAAMTKNLSIERYWIWYEKLHKILIQKDIFPALYYDINISSDDIEAEFFDKQKHNSAINQALSKDPRFIRQIIDKFYTLGENTWSIVGISLILSKLKQGLELSKISPPSFLEIWSHAVFQPSAWIEWPEIIQTIHRIPELFKNKDHNVQYTMKTITPRISAIRKAIGHLLEMFYK